MLTTLFLKLVRSLSIRELRMNVLKRSQNSQNISVRLLPRPTPGSWHNTV